MRVPPLIIAGIIQISLLPIQATRVLSVCLPNDSICEDAERTRQLDERMEQDRNRNNPFLQPRRPIYSPPNNSPCVPSEWCMLTSINGDTALYFKQIDFYGRYRRSNVVFLFSNGTRSEMSSKVDCAGRRLMFSDQNIWGVADPGSMNEMYVSLVCR